MSFGSSKPPPATPPPQVPQKEDPESYEARRRLAMELQDQEGRQAHLLASNNLEPLPSNRKRLLGVSRPAGSQSARLLS